MNTKPELKAKIVGIESYFPSRIMSNADFEKFLNTNDEWIVERTGIKERRIGEAHETPGFMSSEAAKKLLERLKISPDEIDLIIMATITPDYSFPAAAAVVQRNIGAMKAWGMTSRVLVAVICMPSKPHALLLSREFIKTFWLPPLRR